MVLTSSHDYHPASTLSFSTVCLQVVFRLRVVTYFSSGIVEHPWKSPHERKGDTRWGERKMRDYRLNFLSPHHVSPFLTWVDFHTCSRFTRSTIPEEKWGTIHSLGGFWSFSSSFSFWWPIHCYVAVAVWSCLSICPKSRNLGDIWRILRGGTKIWILFSSGKTMFYERA